MLENCTRHGERVLLLYVYPLSLTIAEHRNYYNSISNNLARRTSQVFLWEVFKRVSFGDGKKVFTKKTCKIDRKVQYKLLFMAIIDESDP